MKKHRTFINLYPKQVDNHYPTPRQTKGIFDRFCESVQVNWHRKGNQRLGQFYFNLLEEMNPSLANDIRGTAIDPFHKAETDYSEFFNWLFGKQQQEEEQ